jgi:hypothetical protein
VAAAGDAGYLEKYLHGLTPGNTLALTIGAAGAATPTSGGASSLASGTQTITTLTANGGTDASSGSNSVVSGAGGTATNGDLNVTGGSGIAYTPSITAPCIAVTDTFGASGSNPLHAAGIVLVINTATAGTGYGGGAVANGFSALHSAAGSIGICFIDWYQ